MSNTPLDDAFTRAGQQMAQGLIDGMSGDGPSGDALSGAISDGALFDWMSDEGLLDWVTCEANCD